MEVVPDTKRGATYNRLSKWYDWIAASESHFGEQVIERLHVLPGARVLEIGPGTGKGLLALAKRVGPTGKIVGVDLSTGMLRIARNRMEKNGLGEITSLVMGDGADLPFLKDSFDVVFLAFTLELFSPQAIDHVLRECQRVLCDNGRLGLACLVSTPQPNQMVRVYEWTHRRWPVWIDCRPISAREYLLNAGFDIHDARSGSLWGLPVGMYICEK